MNKRKLRRAKGITKKKSSASQVNEAMIMNSKANLIIEAALQKEPKIDVIGNFIFFSTLSGDAWMLDHRGNRALQLVDTGKTLGYKILESKDRFAVEWKERFQIKDDLFIAKRKEDERIIENYPTKTIQGIIDSFREGQ